jgi:hypothetical protein
VHAGWSKNHRKYGCLIHRDIKDGKIWIQHDGTERGVANALVELGVPKDDIVLAYQPPYKRAYTPLGGIRLWTGRWCSLSCHYSRLDGIRKGGADDL